MAHSLLAHLYSRIRGSQEDVATIALQYLLSQSDVLNQAFTQLLATTLHITLEKQLQYTCQSVGENNERPDMSGTDSSGQEQVLCEMKFYAGLTENQPIGYLNRLQSNGGLGLVFICPSARKIALWSEILARCPKENVTHLAAGCVCIGETHLAIMTWSDVLAHLHHAAEHSAAACLSDLYQLEGYCEQMDKAAFIPFSAEDLAADAARKAERYYDVIDQLVELLCADNELDAAITGRASTYRYYGDTPGYERKLTIGSALQIAIAYDHALWKSPTSIETPFWISIRNFNGDQPQSFHKQFLKIPEKQKDNAAWSSCYLALEAPRGETMDSVCQNLKQQVISYLDLFRANV